MFCNHLDGEERELDALLNLSSWCLILVVSLRAMGLSAVCDCDILILHTDLLFLGVIHENSDGFGECAHLLGLV